MSPKISNNKNRNFSYSNHRNSKILSPKINSKLNYSNFPLKKNISQDLVEESTYYGSKNFKSNVFSDILFESKNSEKFKKFSIYNKEENLVDEFLSPQIPYINNEFFPRNNEFLNSKNNHSVCKETLCELNFGKGFYFYKIY